MSLISLFVLFFVTNYLVEAQTYTLRSSPNPDLEKFGDYSDTLIRTAIFSSLSGRIPKTDKRYNSYAEALKLMADRNSFTLIELGTAREGEGSCGGDGCSTPIFAHFSFLTGRHFTSIDISEKNCERAREAIRLYADNAQVIKSDSVEYLKEYKRPIDFLYLDSVDYDFRNPRVSQEQNLKEIKAAYENLHKYSIILMDDCTLPGGGKCKLAANFLLENGWEKLVDSYQIIFIHSTSIL
ncbi:unnamed protein product [Blepharisma stoltei]|uniref:Class I SAM-dependent methyltransferase n=1 Tax=Blepharisma stoltei TaxID=1481888 RepID=A0AAU9IXZ6_9CILI|nr:unnamed protein product [Blepharisma stoltei]